MAEAMLRRSTHKGSTQAMTHMAPWMMAPMHTTTTGLPGTGSTATASTDADMWKAVMPERDPVADMMRKYKAPTATVVKPVHPTPTPSLAGTKTASATSGSGMLSRPHVQPHHFSHGTEVNPYAAQLPANTALNQLEAWKREITSKKTVNSVMQAFQAIRPQLLALDVSPEQKQDFIEFVRKHKNSIDPSQKADTVPAKKQDAPTPTPTPAKPSTVPTPQPTTTQPSSQPLKNLQQSMFRKIFEWGMGKLGLGALGRAKKQAENIAFAAQSPEQLFRTMHGLNASQQEEVLNSWVQGWKANLNRHKQHTATYDTELKKFQTQLKATLAHMHKILPPSQIALLTSDSYGTDALDHPTVKMNVLDAHEGQEVAQKVIHTQDGINVHHRETPWAEYMFSLAVEYVKNEISTYLKGQTQGAKTPSQPTTSDLDAPAY